MDELDVQDNSHVGEQTTIQVDYPEGYTPPQEQQTASNSDTLAHVDRALAQAQAQSQREIDSLKRQLDSRPSPDYAAPETKPYVAPRIPVSLDDNENAVVDSSAILKEAEALIERKISQFNDSHIKPLQPTVEAIKRDDAASNAAEILRQKAPDLFTEGVNAKELGKAALDFYVSPYNTGVTQADKEAYAIDRVRSMVGTMPQQGQKPQDLPFSSGNSAAPASNQVGRTSSGTESQAMFNHPRGSTIRIPLGTINDAGGISEFQQLNARAAQQYEAFKNYSNKNGMNWNVVIE